MGERGDEQRMVAARPFQESLYKRTLAAIDTVETREGRWWTCSREGKGRESSRPLVQRLQARVSRASFQRAEQAAL